MAPDFKEVERIFDASLAEDIGSGDITAQLLIPATAQAKLAFVTREPMTVCGANLIAQLFTRVDASIKTKVNVKDGDAVGTSTRLLEVTGPARAILTAERTALNLLQRMCAVATLTAQYVNAVQGTKAKILDTRKTMPGLRVLDKYAVRAGGGTNHRMRLDDAILIKDNHIAVCGSVAAAVEKSKTGNVNNLPLEVECDTIAQMEEALTVGITLILLDNMDNETLREAVKRNQGRAILEASGNVTLATVQAIAQTGVDRISVGRITHSAPNVDISLDVVVESK